MRSTPAAREAWLWPALGLASIAVLAPQLLGGATELTALLINVLASAACLVVAWKLRQSETTSGALPLAGIGALVVAGWTLLQALPMPCSWVAWAQPERAALMAELSALKALEGQRCSLSASPGSTWGALAMATSLAALLLASAAVARRGGRSVLVRSVAVSSVLMAVVALAHWVLGAKDVFGLYDPVYANPRMLVAPLLNENHLAGHLALGLPVCLALAVSAERRDVMIAWFTAAALVFATGVLSLSRGGVIALLFSGATFVTYRLLGRRRRRSSRTAIPLTIAAAICLGLGAFVGYDLVAQEFAREGFDAPSKFKLVADLMPLALQHPLAGVGRGALGDVSPHVLLLNARALYAENLPAQWLIEWGLPASLLLACAAVASIVRIRFRQAHSPEIALGCGLAALVLQNVVDFSLELPGVASTAAVAFGCLLSRERPPPSWASIPLREVTIASVVAAILATGISAPWRTAWSKSALRNELSAPPDAAGTASFSRIQTAFAAYPIDPTFVVLAAAQAARSSRPDTGRWLNLAMRVAPGWAGPHLTAAEVLERRGAIDQAAIELSLAAATDPFNANARACKLVQRYPHAEIAWAAADLTPERRQASLEQLASCLPGTTHQVESELFAERVLAEYPQSVAAHGRFIMAARMLGNPTLALERAQAMLRALPRDPSAVAVAGGELIRGGRAEDALRLVESLGPELRDHRRVLGLEASAVAALKLSDRLDQVAEKLLARHGRTSQTRAEIHRLLQALYAGMGAPIAALKQAQAAYDLTSNPADLEQVHSLSLRAGLLAVALRAASELCQLRHRGETFCRPSDAPGGRYEPTQGLKPLTGKARAQSK